MNRKLQSTKLIDLLPPSLKNDPDVQAASEAADAKFFETAKLSEVVLIFPNLGKQPEEVIDHLAYQLHVDFYELNLPLEQKVKLVETSIMWHMKKGTRSAVEEIVSIIFRDAKVREWFEYGGKPYYFRLEIEDTLTESTDYKRLLRLVNATKNERSWLENITIKRAHNLNIRFGAIISERKKITLQPMKFKMPTLNLTKYRTGIISMRNKITIKVEV